MKEIKGFFRLIRIPNLILVALTQYLLRYCILLPIFAMHDVTPILNSYYFHLFVLSTVLISAAGYIINDYFDVQIDLVNKPHKVVIGKLMHRHLAMAIHLLFNIVGVFIGFFIGWKLGNYQLGYIQLISAGLLWFYSTNYKRQFIVGNIIVSILTAMTVMTVGFFEPILYNALSDETKIAAQIILLILAAYSFFSFMISLIREIVKDMEDTQGDADYNCKTIPIVLGIKRTKIIISVLTIILIFSIGFVQYKQLATGAIHPMLYVLFFIQLPLVYFLWLLRKAVSQYEFHSLSRLIKGIMLFGILSMAYFYFFSLKG